MTVIRPCFLLLLLLLSPTPASSTQMRNEEADKLQQERKKRKLAQKKKKNTVPRKANRNESEIINGRVYAFRVELSFLPTANGGRRQLWLQHAGRQLERVHKSQVTKAEAETETQSPWKRPFSGVVHKKMQKD